MLYACIFLRFSTNAQTIFRFLMDKLLLIMAIGKVPYDSLKVFAEAGRRKSFKAAAAQLNISPAAVSQRIRQLEERLAVRLFIRKTRKVILTDEGQLLLDSVESGFRTLESGLASVANYRDQRPIYVAATNTFADQCLLPSIGDYQESHPDGAPVRLVVSVDLMDLEAEKIDFAIRQGDGNYPGCQSLKLAPSHYVAVCAAHRQQDVLTLPLINVEWPAHMHSAPNWQRWLELNPDISLGERPTIGVSIESMAIRTAVSGQGLALTDRLFAQRELEAGELVVAFPGANTMRLDYGHFLVRPNDSFRQAAEPLWQWLLNRFSSAA